MPHLLYWKLWWLGRWGSVIWYFVFRTLVTIDTDNQYIFTFKKKIGKFQVLYYIQGFWYFAEKKAKFRGIFRGKFAEKSADFAGRKSKFAEKSADFWYFFRKKVKIRRKIGRFRGIFAEKSQISKDFQRQILRKIGRFHGKFRGETSPWNNQ